MSIIKLYNSIAIYEKIWYYMCNKNLLKGVIIIKLAEALMLRSEYQQKIQNMQQRIMMNLKVQEDEKPHEDPNSLLSEIMRLNDELASLIKKINQKNNEVTLENGQTLAEALANRESLMKKRQILNNITNTAGQRDMRMTHTEVKINTTVDVAKIQKEIDEISKQFRQIDTQIQSLNWIIDLE